MKKKILFVDDDPFVLKALQRMMHGLREEWDMEFVGSGAGALERLSQTAFDVIVTDMRMPGMNGAELLNQVARSYPKTIRIVLSGHADTDLILKCVNSTHQYLSKPCDSQTIRATVRRACGLESTAEGETLKVVVARMKRLPSLPSLYVEIVEELNQPSATIEHIGEIVSQDLAMTAQFLKLVNSAFFGLPQPVASAAEAALYLGSDTIKSLVLSIHTFSQFNDLESQGFNLDALMHHSLRTAGRAKLIAHLEDAPQRTSNECFVGGMLHDIGKLLLAANCPTDYQKVTRLTEERGISGLAAEKEVFGVDHASVGGYLLGLWGLPVQVVEAIALHHAPQRSTSPGFCALTAVHAANAFEQELNHKSNFSAEDGLDGAYLAALGLTSQVELWRQASLGGDWKGA